MMNRKHSLHVSVSSSSSSSSNNSNSSSGSRSSSKRSRSASMTCWLKIVLLTILQNSKLSLMVLLQLVCFLHTIIYSPCSQRSSNSGHSFSTQTGRFKPCRSCKPPVLPVLGLKSSPFESIVDSGLRTSGRSPLLGRGAGIMSSNCRKSLSHIS